MGLWQSNAMNQIFELGEYYIHMGIRSKGKAGGPFPMAILYLVVILLMSKVISSAANLQCLIRP